MGIPGQLRTFILLTGRAEFPKSVGNAGTMQRCDFANVAVQLKILQLQLLLRLSDVQEKYTV
jgi:hypothetical protein